MARQLDPGSEEYRKTVDELFWDFYMCYYDMWDRNQRIKFNEQAVAYATKLGIGFRQDRTGELKKLGLGEEQYT